MQLTDREIKDGWEIKDGVACWNGVNDSLYKIKEFDGGKAFQLEIYDNQGYAIAFGIPTARFADSMGQARRLSSYED